MKSTEAEIIIEDDDLKKIFGLFTSCTEYEREQIYDERSTHYFRLTDLSQKYRLWEEKRELALDAWRSVLSFLHSEGYSLVKGDKRIDLSFIENEYLDR